MLGSEEQVIARTPPHNVLYRGAAVLVGVLLLFVGCKNEGIRWESEGLNPSLGAPAATVVLSEEREDLVIRVIVEGKEVFPTAEQQERLLAITLELFSSCTIRSRQRVIKGDWQRVWESGNCVHAHFAQPRVIESPARPQTKASDILVPLGDGGRGTGEMWVRDGTTYYSPFMDCEESLRAKLKQVITEDL